VTRHPAEFLPPSIGELGFLAAQFVFGVDDSYAFAGAYAAGMRRDAAMKASDTTVERGAAFVRIGMDVKRLGLAALLLCAFALAGCGDDGTAEESPTDPLLDRKFTSTAVTEKGMPRPLVAGTRIELRFNTSGHFSANTGCNTIEGLFHRDGDALVVADTSITKMGCPRESQVQEDWLVGVLDDRPTLSVTGSDAPQLELTRGDTIIRLSAEKLHDPPLQGTRWVVGTLIDKGTATPATGPTEASVEFSKTGYVLGFAGCNQFFGRAMVSGSTIRLEPKPAHRRPCGSAADRLERAVLAVVEADEVTYRIADGHLTLTAGEHALRLTA
jgi:heat shock protein HslJ